jgi:outer membrane lipoprotein-sorting protein
MSMRGLGAWALAGLVSAAAAAGEADSAPTLTADQIVEKNVAARGGLEAWRKIRTMVWTGRIQTGNPSAPTVPFVLEYKRPNKMRFEIKADHEKSVRVFDGTAGWRARTSSSGAPTVKPYSPLELRSARDAQGIGGLLIDHQTRGIKVALEGTDEVEGHRAYRLAVTLASGSTRHVWVDAQTFLDLKYDRESHASGGSTGTASVFYRNYRTIDGLQIPMTMETGAEGGNAAEKMVIDDVTLNPSLSDAHFEKPNALQGHKTQRGLRSAFPAGSDVPHALESKK